MKNIILGFCLTFFTYCGKEMANKNIESVDSLKILSSQVKSKKRIVVNKNFFGKGLVKIYFKNRDYYENEIVLYEDSLGLVKKKWNLKSGEIEPMLFYPDAELLLFSCIGITNNYYEISVSKKDSIVNSLFIAIDSSTQYISWDTFLLDSYGLRRKGRNVEERSKFNMFAGPSERYSIIKTPNNVHELFCVEGVKDDWVKVKYDCIYGTDADSDYEGLPCKNYINKCTDDMTGWLQWRNNDSLLVDLYLTP